MTRKLKDILTDFSFAHETKKRYVHFMDSPTVSKYPFV